MPIYAMYPAEAAVLNLQGKGWVSSNAGPVAAGAAELGNLVGTSGVADVGSCMAGLVPLTGDSGESTRQDDPQAPGWKKRSLTPCLGTTFDSISEAYDFYNLYSWERGFGVRYGKSRLNSEKTKCMQEIVCRCSGKPTGENTRSCRCECPAMIRSLRSADNVC
ncbi:hypothetical protein ACQ4PT_063806 [Festuca glaucescens]